MLANIPLDHLTSAQKWLAGFDRRTKQRGEDYFHGGKVFESESYKRGVGVRGRVSGSFASYETKVRMLKDGWSSECTCPVGINCKHAYALLSLAIANAGQTQTKGSATTQKAGKPQKDESSFETIFAGKLKRPLDAADRRAMSGLEALYSRHRYAKLVAANILDPITGKRSTWSYDMVQLWPETPQSRWELWLSVAAYLRQNRLPMAAALREGTDWNEVDARLIAVQRREDVSHWLTWLAKVASSPERTPDSPGLRLRLMEDGIHLEARSTPAGDFTRMKVAHFGRLSSDWLGGRLVLDEASLRVWRAFYTGYGAQPHRGFDELDSPRILNSLLRQPDNEQLVVAPGGGPFRRAEQPLVWKMNSPDGEIGDYQLAVAFPDGSKPPPPLVVLDGEPSLYITRDAIFSGPPLGGLPIAKPIVIPSEALETGDGISLLDRLRVEAPPRIASRIRVVPARLVFKCSLWQSPWDESERLMVEVTAMSEGKVIDTYTFTGWKNAEHEPEEKGIIVRLDRRALALAPELVETLKANWNHNDNHWQRAVGKKFALQFTEWLDTVPPGVEVVLAGELATLRGGPVTARLKLEVEEKDIDWFDLRVALDVTDTELTKAEIRMLLDARGGFVRLGKKGWKRLAFELSPEDEQQLADLGLDARDFSSEPQRLHALQLAGKKAAKKFMRSEQVAAIDRRIEDIQMRVVPEIPPTVTAELRPYQVEGFHFLAYLSANRFGGVLADDMGLGKTLQTLTWLMWLRAQANFDGKPALVVCPKSVMDNWRSEVERFVPGLRVRLMSKGDLTRESLDAARKSSDIVVVNYPQLRILEEELCAAPWHTIILDEAQAIKNPDSQTAKAAWSLKGAHRLALSGTPIENRLLDLWSIMAFAMPGVLGARGKFSRGFDQRTDPLARRRLGARVRPFTLRRTKAEVAKDLPERIEEDLVCEMEGEQATLYSAELKRARAALLKLNTQRQLDAERFNILTSLLRLRQICCHPALVSQKAAKADSAKLSALLDLLEPLMAEGHKVLVFSQFVEMLERIRTEVAAREWPLFMLTGATEDRGPLVANFQATEGAAVFLISLRAGGFGLNLTAASYVVLFDPWWNPAVENQAIDRTHRIGQKNQVIAYRLIVKDSIEEKIRALQRQKSALAADILGEENFARALTLDDFRFLLGGE